MCLKIKLRMMIDENKGMKLIIKTTRCLKITEKVSFNIASEAGYVYILNGQKLIKNPQNEFLKN